MAIFPITYSFKNTVKAMTEVALDFQRFILVVRQANLASKIGSICVRLIAISMDCLEAVAAFERLCC